VSTPAAQASSPQRWLHDGQPEQARHLRAQAFEAAPATPGSLNG
jgi:hypothetical protein